MPCDVAVMEQRVILEDEPDPAAVRRDRRDVLAVEQDTPCVGSLQARDRAEERALPGAARAEHGDDLAARDVERDAVERERPSKRDRDVLDPEHLEPPATSHAQTIDEQDGDRRHRHQHDGQRVGLSDVQLPGPTEEAEDRDR